MVEVLGEGAGTSGDPCWSRSCPARSRIIDAEVPGATLSHLLDAAAILWTARRIFAKAAVRIPSEPEWDEQGLRMETCSLETNTDMPALTALRLSSG